MPTVIPQTREGVLNALRVSLQTAIELEFATIPLYTTVIACLSNKQKKTSKHFLDFVRIAYQEMLHLGLVCNILRAVGGKPAIASWAPCYEPPLALPGHNQTANPISASLDQLSKEAIVTFLQIELPEQDDDPPERWDCWDTIGQFYRGVEALIQSPLLRSEDFRQGEQMPAPSTFFPKFRHGQWYEVRDRDSALLALREIVREGEGSRHSQGDGEPGGELAHYFQLRAIYREMGGTQTGIGPRNAEERALYLETFDETVYADWKASNILRNLVRDPERNRPSATARAQVEVGGQTVEMSAQQAEDWFTSSYSAMLDALQAGVVQSPPALGEGISGMATLDPPLDACTSFTVTVDGQEFLWSPTFRYRRS